MAVLCFRLVLMSESLKVVVVGDAGGSVLPEEARLVSEGEGVLDVPKGDDDDHPEVDGGGSGETVELGVADVIMLEVADDTTPPAKQLVSEANWTGKLALVLEFPRESKTLTVIALPIGASVDQMKWVSGISL